MYVCMYDHHEYNICKILIRGAREWTHIRTKTKISVVRDVDKQNHQAGTIIRNKIMSTVYNVVNINPHATGIYQEKLRTWDAKILPDGWMANTENRK